MSYRVGIDIGGTFTGIVLLVGDGRALTIKVPSTPDDYSHGIAEGLGQAMATLGMDDVLEVRLASGGGYSDPFTRPPERVLADVVEEKISAARAEAAYGVVIAGTPPRVDAEATASLRAARQ
jgi:N-methylhydantoinase B/oxoprolinase/acetone carboxylase alpha subunit